MQTCDVCHETMDLSHFTTRSPACSDCVHAWWVIYMAGKKKTNGKGKRN